MSYDNRTRLIVTIFDEPFMMLKKNRNDSLTEKTIPRVTILDPLDVEGYCADLSYALCHERLKLLYKFLIFHDRFYMLNQHRNLQQVMDPV